MGRDSRMNRRGEKYSSGVGDVHWTAFLLKRNPCFRRESGGARGQRAFSSGLSVKNGFTTARLGARFDPVNAQSRFPPIQADPKKLAGLLKEPGQRAHKTSLLPDEITVILLRSAFIVLRSVTRSGATPPVGFFLVFQRTRPGTESNRLSKQVWPLRRMSSVTQVARPPLPEFHHMHLMKIFRAVTETGRTPSWVRFCDRWIVTLPAQLVVLTLVSLVISSRIRVLQQARLHRPMRGVTRLAQPFARGRVGMRRCTHLGSDIFQLPPFDLNGHVVTGKASFSNVRA